jgi:hypothetical protein
MAAIGAAAAADLDHLDHRRLDRHARARVKRCTRAASIIARDRGRPFSIMAGLGGRAAHVEGEITLESPRRLARTAPSPSPPPAGPDSRNRIGRSPRRGQRDEPAG